MVVKPSRWSTHAKCLATMCILHGIHKQVVVNSFVLDNGKCYQMGHIKGRLIVVGSLVVPLHQHLFQLGVRDVARARCIETTEYFGQAFNVHFLQRDDLFATYFTHSIGRRCFLNECFEVLIVPRYRSLKGLIYTFHCRSGWCEGCGVHGVFVARNFYRRRFGPVTTFGL